MAALAPLAATLARPEWILHAASQDLPCLAEVGLRPRRLFDTELAARLLGLPRVGLASLVEELLGFRLAKEHSAVDWSTRPLPLPWLDYAALDVEVLLELRDLLAGQLDEAGKREWADQEFAALARLHRTPAAADRPVAAYVGHAAGTWPARAGVVRELWQARDEIARDTDRAPSKILPDVAIAELAAADHPDRATLYRIAGFQRRQARRYLPEWLEGLQRVSALRDAELPPMHIPSPGPPQPRLWASKDPAAAGRLNRVREALTTLATEHELPAENLLTPDYVRRLAWTPPNPLGEEAVDAALAELGARPWQRRLTAAALSAALAD